MFVPGGDQGRLSAEVARANSDGAGAAGEFQRDRAVLYCTFSRGGEPDQVLRAEVVFDVRDGFRDLLRRVAEIKFSAGERGHLVEEADVREVFTRTRFAVDRLLRFAKSERIDRNRDA